MKRNNMSYGQTYDLFSNKYEGQTNGTADLFRNRFSGLVS